MNNRIIGRAPSVDQNDLLTDLLHCWEMDEITGSVSYDAHGSNDGAITGATINQTGIIDKSYLYDGNDDYIIPSTSPVIGTAFSISVWVKANAGFENTYGTILCRLLTSWSAGDFMINISESTGLVEFKYRDSTNTGVAILSTTDINDGTWHNIIITFASSTAKIYIDGTLEDTGTITGVSSNGNYFAIGRKGGLTTHDFKGNIDQTGIWSSALSTDKITSVSGGLAYSSWN